MTVRRVVANIGTDSIEAAKVFYGGVLGMTVAMDLGWIVTFATDALTTPQVSVAMEGGSGTRVPDVSVEVDNLDEVYERAALTVGDDARRFGAQPAVNVALPQIVRLDQMAVAIDDLTVLHCRFFDTLSSGTR